MKSSTVQALVALLAGTAAIGLAAPAGAVDNNRAARADAQADARDARDPERMVCVRTQLTGSRLMRRICRTAAEWTEDGEVPEAR